MPKSMKWEHMILRIFPAGDAVEDEYIKNAERELDKFAEDGWEVVSAWSDRGESFVLLRHPK